ncbi:hypothetical protein JTP67_15250 [Streptomyces sp. S12]|nr:hypothetical protein [Streptomyces sp. S12]
MTRSPEPQVASARRQLEALLEDLGRRGTTPPDPSVRAQLNCLRTLLSLMEADAHLRTPGQRLSLLRRARAHARTTTVLTAHLLNEATHPR